MTAPPLHPYPTFKSSGVPWLGDVPEHWEVTRLKVQLSRNDSGVWGGDFSDTGTVVVRSTEQTLTGRWAISSPARINLSPRDVAAALLKRGDLVVTKSSGSQAHIGKTTLVDSKVEQLQCCFSNFMQRLRLNANTLPKLTWYTLNSPIGREQLVYQSTSTSGLGNLNGTILGNCVFPLPPLPEQAAIVRYLDYVDRRIRRYVAAKVRLVGLLEEEKQAVITRAVTRGLDPNVPLKPSGVEWLGDVPAQWERRRLKTIVTPIDRRSATGSETLLSLRRDYGVVPYAEHFTRPSQSRSLIGFKLVSVGQLVVNRLQANNGLVFNSAVDGVVSPDYSVFEKKSPLQMQFLSDLLRTSSYRAYFRQNAKGLGTGMAGFLRLYDDAFLETSVFLPPVIEQAAIVEYVDKATAEIDAAIDRARRQIELIQEYRTRLIADVVTGQLDVREAAVDLPDEADDRDPMDESGRLAENVDGSVRDANEAVGELATAGEVTV